MGLESVSRDSASRFNAYVERLSRTLGPADRPGRAELPAGGSHAEKDALIVALTERLVAADERIAAQGARIATLEARLDQLSRPPKASDNSSKPPSQGQKQDRPAPATDRPPRKSRPVSAERCTHILIARSTGC